MRRRLLALAAVSASTAATLGVLEAGLRLAGPGEAPRSGALARDPVERVRYTDDPPLRHKSPGTFRIIALGDSFTFGWRVHPHDTYPARLESHLDALPDGVEFEVINAGRPSWNTTQQRRHLERHLLDLEPDLVLLGYCLNDPEPTSSGARDARRGALARRAPAGAAARLHAWSHLYRLAWERLENARQRRAFDAYFAALHHPDNDGWWQSIRAIESMGARLEQRGVPFVVVVFPMFEDHLDDEYRYRAIHERLASVLAERHIRHLDLLSAYRGIDARRLAVDPFVDAHPSELALRIAADRILLYLIEHELVPWTRPEAPAGA